jgi:hypothetical protein
MSKEMRVGGELRQHFVAPKQVPNLADGVKRVVGHVLALRDQRFQLDEDAVRKSTSVGFGLLTFTQHPQPFSDVKSQTLLNGSDLAFGQKTANDKVAVPLKLLPLLYRQRLER